MAKYYTDEKSVQVVIALLKEHNIRKIVASPGGTNVTIVGSMQNDPFFEIYSSVDERSAAYIACGLAAESGEPVVLSCTGATASRNYMSGLTEAYYRKLPILAITSTQNIAKVGHHIAQVIDRSILPNDVVNLSVELPIIKDDEDLWECEVKVNKAILELNRSAGGPVHINLPTTYSRNYQVKELPKFRVINRIKTSDKFPELPLGRIAVFVGSHKKWSANETSTLEMFCALNNAVVLCDHTSGYKGKYRVLFALAAYQKLLNHPSKVPDVLIQIGEVSGDYYSLNISGKQVWRVSEDGEIRDTYRKLRYMFEMSERDFFNSYINADKKIQNEYFNECQTVLNSINSKIPELPFSNIWMASQLAGQLPKNSAIHFGILNSLRAWNFFEIDNSINSESNVGGFGIDGCVSSLIGASLVSKEKLYFGVVGDLAFFYDLNAVGNRHVGNNIRILLINNGKGAEFRNFSHAASEFDKQTDEYIAAAGHYGNKSGELIKNYAKNLGFDYITANNKDEFEKNYPKFITSNILEKPVIFEVFTNNEDESNALEAMMYIIKDKTGNIKNVAKQVIGQKGIDFIKKKIK